MLIQKGGVHDCRVARLCSNRHPGINGIVDGITVFSCVVICSQIISFLHAKQGFSFRITANEQRPGCGAYFVHKSPGYGGFTASGKSTNADNCRILFIQVAPTLMQVEARLFYPGFALVG